MLSFHGDPAIKEKYLARVAAHRAADSLVQGLPWSGTKGCAIGCTLEAYDHSRYPIELGVPMELARLEDSIFEGLKPEEAQQWPERFLSAIEVGRDLSMVWPKFAVWMLRDLEAKFSARAPKSAKACGDVAALYDRWIADADDAGAAADADAAYAAYDAAYAAAYAAYAVGAADARSARHKFWTDAANKLEELLRAA